MNLRDAKKIYKDVIVTLQDREFYKECSNNMMRLIKYLFPTYEQFSIDECFVDYTEMRKLYGNEVKFAHKLKDEIYKRFGFTVNVGIGNNKLLAKMASDMQKPLGLVVLRKRDVKEKLYPLSVKDIFGIGKKTYPLLIENGIETIGDFMDLENKDLIISLIGINSYNYVVSHVQGNSSNVVDKDRYSDTQSISTSSTLRNV